MRTASAITTADRTRTARTYLIIAVNIHIQKTYTPLKMKMSFVAKNTLHLVFHFIQLFYLCEEKYFKF